MAETSIDVYDMTSSMQRIKKYAKQFRDVAMIIMSGLFNRKWYLDNNPDIAQENITPVLHYLLIGGFDGRDPSPDFSSSWYLNTYIDVKESGINPLLHYIIYGQNEGRGTCFEGTNYVYFGDGYLKSRKNKLLKQEVSGQKIFCVGSNKTGTTSVKRALRDFGYTIGDQKEAELLINDWAIRDFRRIVQYCKQADAYQDIPFSLGYTYQILDYAFPDSKFILTVRNNADEWYQSLIRFHSKVLGLDTLPTSDDLKNFVYREKGYLWRVQKYVFGVDETTLYDKNLYTAYYENHNEQILAYFRFRPNDLLILNLVDEKAMRKLCNFLGIEYKGQVMPHLNQSGK